MKPAMTSSFAIRATALAAALTAMAPALAQQQLVPVQPPCNSCAAPSSQTPQALPAAPAAPAVAFRLNDLRLTGAEALSAENLRETTAPYIGRDVTLAELEQLAQAITDRYHARGYFLAQAVVPVQTVQNGVVEISIAEGRIGKVDVQVAPEAPTSEARVRGFLAALQPGAAVSAPAYERAMLLLSDQPGIAVGSGLQEGSQPGTTDLAVEVNPGQRFSFSADADNHGTKESGRYRVGGSLRWNSPLGIGDNLDLRAMVSNNDALQLGRIAYELPLGTSGLRLGAGLARINYQLDGEFAVLGAQGKADVADLSLFYPVIRQRRQNLFLRLSVDSKRLTDEYTTVAFEGRKRVSGTGLGWTWELRDDWLGGGYWASSGTAYRGSLSIREAGLLAADQALGGPRTEGSFSKLTFQASRLQSVLPEHSLYLALGGQWASKNLDASEKLSLGGPRAVRAYPSGEVLVDRGLIGTVEWRWSATSELTPYVFYDAARGRPQTNPGLFDTTPASRSLRGAGIGLQWVRAGNFSINASLAWRAGTPAAVTDGGGRNPRLYLQLQKSF